MKPTTYPTVVNLSSLQESGEEYRYSTESGELTQKLKDLIDDNAYKVRIELRPIGNAFEIAGEIHTHLNVSCSLCGRDTRHAVDEDFRELIVIEEERGRGGHTGHMAADLVSDGPFCNYVQSPVFNLGEFIHEHIATEEPYIIECGQPDCEKVMKAAQLKAQDPDYTDANPFSVLKNLKG